MARKNEVVVNLSVRINEDAYGKMEAMANGENIQSKAAAWTKWFLEAMVTVALCLRLLMWMLSGKPLA